MVFLPGRGQAQADSYHTLRVVGSHERYASSQPRALPHSKPADGFYSPAGNQAYLSYDQRHPERAVQIAFHEISHLIAAGHMGPTPPWLTEGLAEYLEMTEVQSQTGTIYPDRDHLQLLRKSKLPPLGEFLAVGRAQWNGDRCDLNYAMAWSLMSFLLQGTLGMYAVKKMVEQAYAHFCEQFSAADALYKAYPGGLRQLELDGHK